MKRNDLIKLHLNNLNCIFIWQGGWLVSSYCTCNVLSRLYTRHYINLLPKRGTRYIFTLLVHKIFQRCIHIYFRTIGKIYFTCNYYSKLCNIKSSQKYLFYFFFAFCFVTDLFFLMVCSSGQRAQRITFHLLR